MILSRRKFIQTTTGISFGFVLAQLSARAGALENDAAAAGSDAGVVPAASPYSWVNIAPTGKITIQSPVDEIGQGSMTALPLILAEELDADWNDVVIEFSKPDDAIYGNPNLAGLVLTVASWAVNSYYDKLRVHGAQMRRILLENAARRWQVPLAELHTEPSRVVHASSNRHMGYGEIAGFAQLPETPPEITAAELKSCDRFRLIGSDLPRRDIPSKCDGSAQYSMDIQFPDLLYACVIRPSLRDAKVSQFNPNGMVSWKCGREPRRRAIAFVPQQRRPEPIPPGSCCTACIPVVPLAGVGRPITTTSSTPRCYRNDLDGR